MNNEIIKDINLTLEKLVNNTAILKNANENDFSIEEFSSLQKMQESLLSHLIFLDNLLKANKATASSGAIRFKIKEKLLSFTQANEEAIDSIAAKSHLVRFSKRRAAKAHLKKKKQPLYL